MDGQGAPILRQAQTLKAVWVCACQQETMVQVPCTVCDAVVRVKTISLPLSLQ